MPEETVIVEEPKYPAIGPTESEKALAASAAAEKQAETGDESETTQETEGEEGKAKGKGGWQRRIDKLTGRLTAEQAAHARELEAERTLRREAEERLAAKTAAAEPQQKTAASDEPAQENYNTVEEFLKAHSRWTARQVLAEDKAAQERELETQRSEEVFKKFNERLTVFQSEVDDFDEALEASKQISIPQSAQVCIIESDNGPEISYYLAKHPEEAAKLSGISDARVAVEIGRLSAKLEKAEPSGSQENDPLPKKQVTKAPAPIKPLGGGVTQSTVPIDQLPIAEYIKKRNEQIKARRSN